MRERRANLERRITSGALAGLLVMTSMINSVGNITVYAAEREKSTAQKITYNSRAYEGVQIQIFDQGSMLTSDGQLALGVRIVNNTDSDLTNGTLTWSKGADLIEAGFMGGETGDMYDDAEIPGLSASPVTEEEAASPGTEEETAAPGTEEETAAPEAEKETEAEEMPFSYDEIGKATPANAEILAVVTQVPMSAALSTSPEPEPSAAAETEPADAAPSEPEPSAAAETEPADTFPSEPEPSVTAETEPADTAPSEPETSTAAETEPTDTAPSEPETSAAAGIEPTETAPSEPETSAAAETEATETTASEPETGAGAETEPTETDPSETEFADHLFSAPASDTYDHNFLSDIELAAGETYEAEFYGYIDFIMTPKNASVAFAFRGENEDGHRVSASTEYSYSIGAAAIGSVTVTSDPLMAGEAGAIEVFTDFADLADGLTTAAEEATGSDAADTGRSLINAAKQVRYELNTYGVALENVRANVVTADDTGVISDITFDVPKNAELGTHYAELIAFVTVNHKTYRAAEGFWFTVDGSITLTADTGTGTVTVSGPRDSFPEADTLELKAYDVETEEVEGLQDAIDKMAEEDGVCLEHIHAVSLELLADGAEAEFTGDVSVEFKGFVEKIEKAVGRRLTARSSNSESGEKEPDDEEEKPITNIVAYMFSEGSLINAGAAVNAGVVEVKSANVGTKMAQYTILGSPRPINLNSYDAFVNLSLEEMQDGSSPWNSTGTGDGKDNSASDKRVRTFDTVTYKVNTTVNATDKTNPKIGGWLYFEAVLNDDPVKVRFDGDNTIYNWANTRRITYYKGNDPISVDNLNLNAIANGNNETDPYSSGITRQVLSGYVDVSKFVDEGQQKDAVTFSANFRVKVYASENDHLVQPSFTMWYMNGEPTDKDGRPADADMNSQNINAEGDLDTKNTYQPDAVTVTAKPMYDIEVTSDNRTTGVVPEPEFRDTLKRIYKNIDISVMLRNEESTVGLKGIELPCGDLEFDLTLYNTRKNKIEGNFYTPGVYDYTENGIVYNENGTPSVCKTGTDDTAYGHSNNRMDTVDDDGNRSDMEYSTLAPADAASNRLDKETQELDPSYFYDGGIWTIAMNEGTETKTYEVFETEGNETKKTTLEVDQKNYRVTIKEYDFDLEEFQFPKRYLTQTENTISDSIGYFTSGHIQVYTSVPNDIEAKKQESVRLLGRASHLNVNSVGKRQVTKEVNEPKPDTDPFANGWATVSNNYYQAETTLYTPGSFAKHNMLTKFESKRFDQDMLVSDLNVSESDSQDAVAAPGDKIRVWGYVDHQNSNVELKSLNILQKFNTDAFEVLDGDVYGVEADNSTSGINYGLNLPRYGSGEKAAVLYGVDPQVPGGWQSTDSSHNVRMNAAYEENLIFFKSIAEMKKCNPDYECTAVLIEARNLHFASGRIIAFGIPVQVKSNATMGQTYATVNSARDWSEYKQSGENVVPVVQPLRLYDNGANVYNNNGWKKNKPLVKLGEDVKPNTVYWKEAGKSDNPWMVDSDNYFKKKAVGQTKDDEDAIGGVITKPDRRHYSYYNDGELWYTKRTVDSNSKGGEQYGQTLLVLSSVPRIDIENDKERANNNYNLDESATREAGVWFDMEVGTKLTKSYPATGADKYNPDNIENLEVTLKPDNGLGLDWSKFTIQGQELDLTNGQRRSVTVNCVGGDGNKHQVTIEVYVENGVLHFDGVPKGAIVPEVRIKTNFAAYVPDGAISVKAEIRKTPKDGEGNEQVPLTERAGTLDSSTVYAATTQSAQIVKSVSKHRIEIGEEFYYTIDYFNNSETSIEEMYLYDPLPYSMSDPEKSHFSGNYKVTKTMAFFYEDGSAPTDPVSITGNPNPNTYSPKAQTNKSEIYVYEDNSGGTSDTSGFYTERPHHDAVPDGQVVNETFFRERGLMAGPVQMSGVGISTIINKAGAVALMVTKLPAKTGVRVLVEIGTKGNLGNDKYVNQAWVNTNGASNLASKEVVTEVVERGVSGVVWCDKNNDGILDTDEERVSGVEVKLWGSTDGGENYSYVTSTTTDSDGAYVFEKFMPGDYIITFGNGNDTDSVLDNYDGATSYRVNGDDDSVTSDGKSVSEEASIPINIKSSSRYVIVDGGNGNLPLNYVDADSMGTELVDYREHRDLGLKNTFETKKIQATKKWEDADNQDGVRPDSVVFKLRWRKSGESQFSDYLKDGTIWTETLTAANEGTDSNTWVVTFDGLPAKYNGEPIEYQVVEMNGVDEIQPNGILPGKNVGWFEDGDNGDYTVSYEQTPTEYNVTTVTNRHTPVTIKKVVKKNWEDVPENLNDIRKVTVALYKQVPKEDGSSTEEPMTPDDTYKVVLNADNNWTKTWEGLPKYEKDSSGNIVKITYKVYEIDNAGDKAEDSTRTQFGDYLFDTSRADTSSGDGTVITETTEFTNKLVKARIRVKKMIQMKDPKESIPANEFDKHKDYKFMIDVYEAENNTAAAEKYASVDLAHEETSGYMEVIPKAGGKWFSVDEIVPMEYEWWQTTSLNATNSENKDITGEKGLQVYPGDDVTITIYNEPHHDDYFHRTASVTNSGTLTDGKLTFKRLTGTDIGDTGGPDEDYTETPVEGGSQQPVTTSTPSLDGLVTDFYEKEEEWNELI